MEATIKQAEEERIRKLSNIKQMYDGYKPMKHHVDMIRSTVGLDPLPSMMGPEEVTKCIPQQ